MNSDLEVNIDPSMDSVDTPETRWIAWAIWSTISLAVVLFVILVAGADTGLLLGWIVGVIVAAMLMVFGR